MKPDKSTSCIVRLKDGSEEKQTDDGRLFHTLTTHSAKKLLRTLLVQCGLNNLYACPLVFVVCLKYIGNSDILIMQCFSVYML